MAAARRACGHGHLPSADARVALDNPLCGDRVSVEVQVSEGRLRGIAHQVRGCLLCEAAASIIAENAVGGTAADLEGVRDALGDALVNGFDARRLPWRALEVFAPVVHHRSRHRCVTLAFEALARALAAAETRTRNKD